MGKIIGETLKETFIKIYEDIFLLRRKKKRIQLTCSSNINISCQSSLDVNTDSLQSRGNEDQIQTEQSTRVNRETIHEKRSKSRKDKIDSAQNSSKRYLKPIRNLKKNLNSIQMEFP